MVTKPSATCFRRLPSPISAASAANFVAHDVGVQRLVLARAEDRREEIGLQLAEHDIGVGDGERAAAAVAGGAGIGAGRIRAGAEASGLEVQDRAAAGRDGVDAHHRRADAHAGDLGVEGALIVAVIMGDVGRGAAHVEADDLVEAGELAPSRPCRRRRRPGRTGSRPCPGSVSAAVRPPDDIMNIRRGDAARLVHASPAARVTAARRRHAKAPPPPAAHSATGSATDRRRRRWCRRGRRA